MRSGKWHQLMPTCSRLASAYCSQICPAVFVVCLQAAGYVPSADKLSCVLCDSSSGNATSFSNGFTLTTAWQPASLTAAGICQCSSAAAGTVVSTVSSAGRDLQRCLICPAGSTADASTGICTPPSGSLSTPAKDLAYVLADLNSNGAGILAAMATQVRSCSGTSLSLPRSPACPLAPASRLSCDEQWGLAEQQVQYGADVPHQQAAMRAVVHPGLLRSPAD